MIKSTFGHINTTAEKIKLEISTNLTVTTCKYRTVNRRHTFRLHPISYCDVLVKYMSQMLTKSKEISLSFSRALE